MEMNNVLISVELLSFFCKIFFFFFCARKNYDDVDNNNNNNSLTDHCYIFSMTNFKDKRD